MPLSYPPAPAVLSGDNLTLSRFLNSPTLIARRLREIGEQRFISDVLLPSRLQVSGGAVAYEVSEGIYATDAPSVVAPGSEYPLTTTGTGAAALAKTVKRGFDTEITDEAVARQNLDPVNRALIKLVNRMVQAVDAVALSAVATGVSASQAATVSWSTATAAQIVRDIEVARAQVRALNQGFEVDTVVLDDITYANVFATLATAGVLPREGGNPILAGGAEGALGLRWLRTPNLPTAGQALLLDSTQLGGIADEDLGGEGYSAAGSMGIQVKSWRPPGRDVTRVRARRVSVPIVLEPQAGRKITGV